MELNEIWKVFLDDILYLFVLLDPVLSDPKHWILNLIYFVFQIFKLTFDHFGFNNVIFLYLFVLFDLIYLKVICLF